MPDDVIVADPVAAPPVQAPVIANDAPSSFAEQQKSWTREQMADWKLTGREPESPAPAKAPAEKTAETTDEPSVTKVRTEAAAEPADEDQELPEGETVEDRRKRNQMFAKIRRERAEFKARAELLDQQRKEKPARDTESAPAPEVKQKAEAPTKFKFREPTNTETLIEYLSARDEALTEFVAESSEKRVFGKMDQRKADETARERDERVQNEYRERANASLKKRDGESTEDHRTRTLQYANASRWFTGQTEAAKAEFLDDAVLESPVGHELMQHYHAHQDEFAALLKASPTRALTILGRVEASFEAKKTPELKPVTRTSTPDPGDRVDATVSAKGDPLKEAYDMHTKTGDRKYLAIAMRLENERAAAKAQRK